MGLTDSLEFAKKIFFLNQIADNQAENFDKAIKLRL